MHVSSKYLELTKRKLELTRLPHELELPENRKWAYGPPKEVLEPLVDHWICDYSWRTEESHYNTALPQFRTAITVPSSNETLRVHFVHKKCHLGELTPRPRIRNVDRVVPLLFCHDVNASSFLDVSGVIDALTTMDRTAGEGDGGGIAFHVIAPSVPGTGFSDASEKEGFGARETAEVFDALMKRLGCVAIHAANPGSFFLPPSLQNTPLEWLKYQLARMTGARISGLSFDYVPADFENVSRLAAASSGKTKVVDEETAGQPELHTNSEPTSNVDIDMGETTCTASRPQTLAFALCDSPVGLLAHTLDVLGPCLAMGRAGYLSAVWSPANLLNWTMMRWLPGPEAGFRWVQRTRRDAGVGGCLWRMHSGVPLGISQFGAQRGVGGRPDGVVRWAQAWQNVRWLKKREGSNVIRPEWESPEELVQDLRESFGSVWNDGNKV
ncbi:hypothetical protein SLS58_003688 [Diplodia intermedia]|uniref:Epoxide hydrolase N-terminal domain-containing protein n=1 Tax=Diplodia intermedia TaxID=856260 RepID=A0ABR3TWV1_9PEZI